MEGCANVLLECVESDKRLHLFKLKQLYERLPMEFSIDILQILPLGYDGGKVSIWNYM